MKLKPVIIEWIDAFGDADNWSHRSELEESPRVIKTCGWLLPKVVKGYKSVALSYDPAIKYVGSVIHIPTINIKSIKNL